MWAKWIGPGAPAVWLAAATTMLSLSAAAVLWLRRGGLARPAFLEVGYLLLLIPLISPQGWDYVLLLGTPAIVCLVDRFREASPGWKTATAAGFLLTSFTIYDLVGRSLYLTLMSFSVITVGALLLAAATLRLRLTRAA
jgi:hypothetical protein